MKRVLLSILVVLSVNAAFSQCDDLFFSEYVEGWSNNKAWEIYNPTNDTVDMYNYQIQRWSNGNDIPNALYTIRIASAANQVLLAPKDVLVVVLDKRDTSGSGFEAPVWEELRNKADIFLCPDYSTNRALYHNGNDAITLEKAPSGQIVDLFAEVGFNPGEPRDGAGWNDQAPNYFTPDTNATAWTTDHTLYRKYNVRSGVTSNPSPFMVNMEWDSLPANTFDSLGTHACECNRSTSIGETEFDNQTTIFPSLVNSGSFRILSESRIQEVRVINLLGAEVINLRDDASTVVVETSDLPYGTYIVHVGLSNGKSYIQKIQIN